MYYKEEDEIVTYANGEDITKQREQKITKNINKNRGRNKNNVNNSE